MKNNEKYRPEWIRNRFDTAGVEEWNRMVRSPMDEVALDIHARILRSAIKPGDYVLELGSGSGRFTELLARMGSKVLVTDISQGQLSENKNRAEELGFKSAVVDWLELDAIDLSRFADESFDAIVAYGGLMSYVFDHRNHVMRECHRILRKNGTLLASVMSLWGTIAFYLEGFLSLPKQNVDAIIQNGDLTEATFGPNGHFCHLFTSGEIKDLFQTAGFNILEISASGFAANIGEPSLQEIRNDPNKWKMFLDFQHQAAQVQFALDGSRHIIMGARK